MGVILLHGTPACNWKMASVGLRLTVENWVFLTFLLDTTINHASYWALLFFFHRSQGYKDGWLSLLRLGPRFHLVKCVCCLYMYASGMAVLLPILSEARQSQ